MKRIVLSATAVAAILCVVVFAQQSDIVSKIVGGALPAIAIADMRGSGAAQEQMGTFNQTLFTEIQSSGQLKMVAKTLYPLQLPQQPSDFKAPTNGRSNGPWLTDWSQPPVSSNYLAFGYTAIRDGKLVFFGWLYNVGQPDVASAQVIGKVYFSTPDENGARQAAREFAADILAQFGRTSLVGSKIFFTSDRSGGGNKEIWSMDYDGKNQAPMTSYRTLTIMPNVSPDGSKIAFTTFPPGKTPMIVVMSTETKRMVPFYNQRASVNSQASFTPDGKRVLFSSTASGDYAQIYLSDADGSNITRLTRVRAVEVEPKVNPKSGTEVVFVSGRGGPPQIYKMNIDGGDVVRLTTGEGEAVNPSWHPDGKHIVFSWTRGFEPGNFNIFVMDVATREVAQLTQGMGKNENPVWAPDGLHIVYSSKRGRGPNQIYTMLADGTQQQQLTTTGNNTQPAWAKGISQ